MNYVTQPAETGDQMNGEGDHFSKFGEVIDLHPVYAAMAQAREVAEANGTEPADVVWDPAWPDLPVHHDDYWNDLVDRNWETLSRWNAMSLAAARKGKLLHFKVLAGVETITAIEMAPASTASEIVPDPMLAIIPPLDSIGPQQAASAPTTPRTFPTATPQELTELRLKLHGNGYHPVPVARRARTHEFGRPASDNDGLADEMFDCRTSRDRELVAVTAQQHQHRNSLRRRCWNRY